MEKHKILAHLKLFYAFQTQGLGTWDVNITIAQTFLLPRNTNLCIKSAFLPRTGAPRARKRHFRESTVVVVDIV